MRTEFPDNELSIVFSFLSKAVPVITTGTAFKNEGALMEKRLIGAKV
jgi:hypothetical protein